MLSILWMCPCSAYHDGSAINRGLRRYTVIFNTFSQTMKIAILGYGKMGHAIEKAAQERGHSIGVVMDNEQDWAFKGGLLGNCDVALEFSTPATAVDNISRCIEADVPVVAGTTGWKEPQLLRTWTEGGGRLFMASNFSIGLNIMRKVSNYLAVIMDAYDDYDVCISETHHKDKKDAPSGTAITLAEEIVARLGRKRSWEAWEPHFDGDEPVDDILQIASIREGEEVGEHEVIYSGPMDSITLIHHATDRRCFAEGAVRAAEFLSKHPEAGVYTMDDMI